MHGIVLCPPVGQEYMRTYMAVRQLAIKLSSVGFDVLKFDYYGVGDSAGVSEEGHPDVWSEDIRMACQELKDVSGVASVSIVGLRLGAALAVEVVDAGLPVNNLVLWDPVINGAEYIDQVRELTLNVLQNKIDLCGEDIENLVGFPFSASSIRRISEIDLFRLDPGVKRNIFLVISEECEEYVRFTSQLAAGGKSVAVRSLHAVQRSGNPEIHKTHVREAGKITAQWSDRDAFDQALIAHYAISEIATLLKSAV